MRHRIGGLENVHMGLGADNISYELDNTWSKNEELNKVADKMLNDALITIFQPRDISGFDFKVEGDLSKFSIYFGFEPAYKHDPYLMCYITSDYKDSYIESGVATECYGKKVSVERHNAVIDKNCDNDYVEFVEKWFPLLCETLTIRLV